MLTMETISPAIEKEISAVAKKLGISRDRVLRRAVASFHRHVDSQSLRDELLAWDAASAADFAAFEKKI